MTAQRKWQISNVEKGLCRFCKTPRVNKSFCEKHRVSTNSYKRKRRVNLLNKKSNWKLNMPKKEALKKKLVSYTRLKELGLL